MSSRSSQVHVESLRVSVYTIPTDQTESDGTLEWDKTTLVLVQTSAGGKQGIGYTYADSAMAKLIQEVLTGVVKELRPFRQPTFTRQWGDAFATLDDPAFVPWPSLPWIALSGI